MMRSYQHPKLMPLLLLGTVSLIVGCGGGGGTRNGDGNTAPNASFTVDPTSGTFDTWFQLDASASSDAQDSTPQLQVRWDYTNNGSWDTEWSNNKNEQIKYGVIGQVTIKLQVRDTGGLLDTATRTVEVANGDGENTAPNASFTVDPTTGTVDTSFDFDASACSDTEDAASQLQVRWDWTNNGSWDTGWSTTKTASHKYTSIGQKTIKLQVRDTGGLLDTATRTVEVTNGDGENTAPNASFTVDPTTGTVDTSFDFDASACSDAEDAASQLQVRWDWTNNGSWDTGWSASKTASHKYTSTGQKTIMLEVRDTGGLIDNATRTVQVNNTAPNASFTVDPTTGTVDTTFDFDASACSDAEDAASQLEVRWDWTNNGSWDTGWSTSKTASHKYTSTGQKTIMLEVRDTGGLIDNTTRTVQVKNTAPNASFTVAPTTGTIDTTFDFDASACSDLEDATSQLEVRWDWTNDGSWDTDWSTTKTASHKYTSIGQKTIKLQVRDTLDLTHTATRSVDVSADEGDVTVIVY